MKRVHLHIVGKVQGVFFRESTREQAERLGVTGWICNLPDGRVEAVVQGQDDAVDRLVAWCHDGPPAADVDAIDVDDEPTTEEFESFQVRH